MEKLFDQIYDNLKIIFDKTGYYGLGIQNDLRFFIELSPNNVFYRN